MIILNAFVHAFDGQVQSPQSRLDAGDVCFIYAWERHLDCPKGSGIECLQSSIKDLKKRFPTLTSCFIDLLPPQFNNWDRMDDPDWIKAQKKRGIEDLKKYLAGFDFGDVSIEPVFNIFEGDNEKAQSALSAM